MAIDQLMKVLVLALLQGVTELFPVSSLGHTVIIPGLLGWGELTRASTFLPIVVVLHMGTAVALLSFFWRDWVALIRAFFKTLLARRLDADPYGRTVWLVIVATIPAGLLGLIFEKKIDEFFFSAQWPVFPAAFLAMNGAVLFAAEQLRQHGEPASGNRLKQEMAYTRRIRDLTFREALIVGFAQATALLPGISRSGATMVAGLGLKMSHEESAHFTFLLLTPLIVAATAKEAPKLLSAGGGTLGVALLGGVLAGVTAFASVKFLMGYFRVGRLTPFALYCLFAGIISFAIFAPLSLGLFTLPWLQ